MAPEMAPAWPSYPERLPRSTESADGPVPKAPNALEEAEATARRMGYGSLDEALAALAAGKVR